MKMYRMLIVDDEKRMCAILKTALENESLAITTADSGEAAQAALSVDTFDIILSDIKMPGMSGLDLLKRVKMTYTETEVLLMTAYADAKTAVEAMKAGAFDYIIKPFEIDELRHKISHIIDKHALRRENKDLKGQLRMRFSLDNMVGSSGAMQKVYQLVQKVAPTDATVLVRGESGTGKELVARALHQLSERCDQPFIAVNCGALPESLLESELFGYERGAFTGAEKQKPGRFELAGHGTIFLDEIGDIPPATQIKLLRVLQQREIVRVGGTETVTIHARTVAATNRNLEEALLNKTFREDLYYRINVFPLFLPPLRERPEDIPDLIAHFLTFQGAAADHIEATALQCLTAYNWPGNVRELENVIERALIMSGGRPITLADLPPHVRGLDEHSMPTDASTTELTLQAMEKLLIHRALEKAQGNKTAAAKMLGITRRQLYSKLERL